MSTFNNLFDDFMQRAKAKAQEGLSLAKCGELWSEAVDLLVAEAAQFMESGSEKKAWVLDQLDAAFDQIAPSIPLPWWLAPFRPFVIGTIKSLVLFLADGLAERAYRRMIAE